MAQDFLTEMDAKIVSMPNDADKFLMRIKLQEQALVVRVSIFLFGSNNPIGQRFRTLDIFSIAFLNYSIQKASRKLIV